MNDIDERLYTEISSYSPDVRCDFAEAAAHFHALTGDIDGERIRIAKPTPEVLAYAQYHGAGKREAGGLVWSVCVNYCWFEVVE